MSSNLEYVLLNNPSQATVSEKCLHDDNLRVHRFCASLADNEIQKVRWRESNI